jgi:hypothetical protein
LVLLGTTVVHPPSLPLLDPLPSLELPVLLLEPVLLLLLVLVLALLVDVLVFWFELEDALLAELIPDVLLFAVAVKFTVGI